MKYFRRIGQRVLSVLLLIVAIHVAAKQFQPSPDRQENNSGAKTDHSVAKVFQSSARNSEGQPSDPEVRVLGSSTGFDDTSEVTSEVPGSGSDSASPQPSGSIPPRVVAPAARAVNVSLAPQFYGSASTHHLTASSASRSAIAGSSASVKQRSAGSNLPSQWSGTGRLGGGGSALSFSQAALSSAPSSPGSPPAASPLVVTFSNPITTTPILIQDGFGPGGSSLPYAGLNFCVPTSATMALGYLGVNGFNQIAPSAPTAASQLNLERVISGLAGTDPLNGTFYTGTPSIQAALKTYLAAEGISTANYSLTITSLPTVTQLASLVNTPGSVVILGCGYYNSTGTRSGGHMITLVGAGINAQGQASPNTIVVYNPLPSALTSDADVAGNSLEYLNTIATSGALTTHGAIELDPNQYPGKWSSSKLFVIETAITLNINTSQLSVNNPTPAAWNLTANQNISLDGGVLPVLAPITGTGGITLGDNGSSGNWQLQAFGTLQLNASDTATGANTINNGTWMSTISSGTPFGTGSITINQGVLSVSPGAGSSNISLSAASASGKTLTFVNGAEIDLALHGNNSLALTIGGNTDAATANLIRSGAGTLVLAPAGGSGDLGQAEQLIVKGTGGNLPATLNGIVAPYIVVANNDSNASGDFVTYGVNGFAKTSYTTSSSTPLASAGSNAVFFADINQTVAASSTVQVYALNAGSATLSGGSASTLAVGTQTGGQAGIILNGGTISTTNLALGSAEGVVYTSKAGGTISSVITGSGGLTAFGPGTLTLQGANTYTGTTTINSGILNAQNITGTVAGGNITVNTGGTLEISGVSAKAGLVTGTTTLGNGGALLLNGGTLVGSLNATSGSFILGSGTVSGVSTLSGTIGNNGTPSQLPAYNGVENITFNSKVTASNLIYNWTLNALDAAPADAGINWSLLTMKGASTVFGTSTNEAYFTLNLGSSVADPNSGNLFWNTAHQWMVAQFTSSYSYFYNWDFTSFLQGAFSMSFNSSTNAFYVNYAPNGNYWKGGKDGTWTGTNWVDGTGVAVVTPGKTDDIAFSATGAANQGATTMGQNFTIHSMTVSDTNAPVVISSGAGGPYSLGIAGSLGTGITVLTGANLTVNSNVILGGDSDTIEVDGAGVAAINGVITGGNGIAKTGTGTLTLAGTNTYTGTTNVTGGQLNINGSTGSGSALVVAAGAIVSGTGTIAGPATINGTVSPGVGIGTITFGGTLSFASTSHLAWGLASNTVSGDQVTAGATTVAAGAVVDLAFNGPGSTVNFLDPFWSQTRTFAVLNATTLTGAYSLGSVGSDANGTNPSWLGSFSLQYTATSVNLVWMPSGAWQDTAWQQWQVTNFAGNWNVPSIAGDNAAPAGDGIPNLLKFGLGANPWVASTASLPVVGIQSISGQQYLSLTFTHSLTTTNVTCTVEVSGDLSGSWNQGSSYSPSNGDVPTNAYTTQVSRNVVGNTETIVVRDNQPITPAVSRRFIHLKVIKP